MFNFCSLYSGSTGNCLFVQSDEANILIDAGVSQKKISDALASFDVGFEDIDGILVTHEHSDHVLNVGSISKRYDIPVYCARNAVYSEEKPVQPAFLVQRNEIKEPIHSNSKFILTTNFKPNCICL